jgi:hypothetical protein
MSNSAPQLFHNISPAQFAVLQQKAAAAGIPISGNSGSASKMGVEVEWTYSPESKQLSLQCLKSPFFISVSDVNKKIHDLVTETLTTV